MIAGLGNPGRAYKGTRHNIGFMVVSALARKHSFEFRKKLGWRAEVAAGKIGAADVLLIMPLTFMNQSGDAVALAMQNRVPLSRCFIVVDDVALPFGQLRIRPRGSSGGHNGLKSIEEQLQTQEFTRLRVGVSDQREGDLASYVLGKFSLEEKKLIPDVLERATQAIEIWLDKGLNHAMDFANQKSPSNPSNGE